MNDAIDLGQRPHRLINASLARRYGHYQCPLCLVRVTWARGKIQRPHFRHAGRTPAERKRAADCDLYRSSFGCFASDPSGGQVRTRDLRPQPRLYVQWYEQRGGAPEWSLSVAVSDPGLEVDFDVFAIQEDAQTTLPRSIPRIVLSTQQRFPVRARPGTYNVRGFDRAQQLAWAPPPTGQLESGGPTVFTIGTTGGYQLEPDEALIRGHSYLLLAPASCRLAHPDTLIVEAIRSSRLSDPRQEWRGHLLFLPQRADEEVEDWCVDVLGRLLEDPPASLEIVFPPAIETADGRFHIEQQNLLVLFLGQGWTDPMFEILDQKTRENPDWRIGKGVTFCGTGPLPAGVHSLFIKEETVGEVERLEVETSTLASPPVQGVVLTTEPAGGRPLQRTDLLDERAAARWSALMTGREELRSIQLPDGWRVKLFWQGRDRVYYGPDHLDDAGALAGLIACQQRRPLFARLDAGTFGAVEWHESAAQPATRAVVLSPTLEARLRWLMLARKKTPVNGAALGIALPRAAVNRLTAPSRPLVEDFLTVSSWPVSLLPQARSVARELDAQLKDAP